MQLNLVVMGDVLANGLQLLGTGRSPLIDIRLKDSIDAMNVKAKRQNLTNRESLHVRAVQLLAEGYISIFMIIIAALHC